MTLVVDSVIVCVSGQEENNCDTASGGECERVSQGRDNGGIKFFVTNPQFRTTP